MAKEEFLKREQKKTFHPSLPQVSVAGLCGDRDDVRSGLNMGVSNLLLGKSLYLLS